MTPYLILYVRDQARSTAFYGAILARAPRLDVPGMTEFLLVEGTVLGLMPEEGIVRLLGPELPDPRQASGTPRCELYLLVENAASLMRVAAEAGAVVVSALQPRDWGHRVGYVLDPDGHVVAFAEELDEEDGPE